MAGWKARRKGLDLRFFVKIIRDKDFNISAVVWCYCNTVFHFITKIKSTFADTNMHTTINLYFST